MKRSLALILFLLFTVLSNAQTLVNQSILDTLGSFNSGYQYTKMLALPTGEAIILIDNYSQGPSSLLGQGFFVVKLSSSGTPEAFTDLYAIHGTGDLGTSMCYKNGYIYIAGLSLDSTGTNSIRSNLYKLDAGTLDTVFTVSQNLDSALMQSGFSVLVDDASNIYLGSSVLTATTDKIAVQKFDSNGNQIWRSNYDTIGLYSTPVAMALAYSGSTIAVTGFSFNGTGNSNFVTLDFTTSTGSLFGVKTTANGTGAISHPCGIVNDTAGNSYIAGTSTVVGTASVFKIVSYDGQFNQRWVKTFGDSTKTNTAVAMCLDQPVSGGHLFVLGTSPNTAGGTDMSLVQYGTDGTLHWSQRLSAPNPANTINAVGIVNDGNFTTYVTGTLFDGTDSSAVTAAYDTAGNLLWMKTFRRTASSNDVPLAIVIGNSNSSIWVAAKSNASDSLLVTVEYDTYTKTNTLTTTSSGGQYVPDQLIVRFDPSVVNQDAVNNTSIDFAPPSYWLTPYADSALAANVPFDLTTCTMERIYKGLKASYKYSTARNGDQVLIPDLWAGFLLIYPDQGKSEETDVAQSINTLFPLVVHTGLNYVGQLMGCNTTDPHPVSCRVNDPLFYPGANGITYLGQQNLWNDSTSYMYINAGGCDNNYNINIDSVWQLETGKPFIKVGIYDSGLDGQNEDFCPNYVAMGNPGSKANGWDFYSNTSPRSTNWANADAGGFAHGTMVSGIIGAIRNNNRGIAGIAGGSYSDTTDVGVTLYDMKILHDSTYAGVAGGTSTTYYGRLTLPVADLCNALTMGCTYVPGSNYGFGLHVINNSWGVLHDSIGFNNPIQGVGYNDRDLRELEQAFKNVYRNQTAIVAAAGNSATDMAYPANFYGDWIICLGGADDTGGRYVYSGNGGQTSYTASYAGSCVDLIAPSYSNPNFNSGYVINTTDYHSSAVGQGGGQSYAAYTNNFHTALGGTSIAAPHATATIADVMSYLDSSAYVYRNISPEDAEHLLTRNTSNAPPGGRNDSVGYGDLNAGRVLQDVNQACKVLAHYGRQDTISYIATLIATRVHISLTEKYTNPITGLSYDTLNNGQSYICDVYKSSHTNSHALASNFSIEDAWTRPSSSALLPVWDSVNHTLQPFEHLYIDSMSTQAAIISGYYYVVIDSTLPPPYIAGTWGIDSGFVPTSTGYEYTLLLNDNSKDCHPIDTTTTTRIKQLANNIGVSFYPNPVEDAAILQVSTDMGTRVSINIYDMQGQMMQSVYSGELSGGTTTFSIDTKSLSSGIYFIEVTSPQSKKNIKFTKI